MRMRMTRLLKTACIASALVGLGMVTVASAADWKNGHAYVESVDIVASTITIGGETIHVPPSCRIQNASGVRVSLSEIRVGPQAAGVLMPMDEVDFAQYQAIKKRSGWEMVEITILDEALE